ncbi:MAG: monoheme cytochrome C [Flavobacteriaceae bacterium]|nr:monoheme cytochrome C [Flavobacteriaceae bacterium]MDH3795818.1 monoheme cytochrome C [Flavobacteriaceae bacterium]
MSDQEQFKEQLRQVSRLVNGIMLIFFLMGAVVLYVMIDPQLSLFKKEAPDTYVTVEPEEDDFDKIENGIHLRTGLKDAEGLMTVVNNCTNCHSALLVTQNRMNEERWKTTIKWMQETQNLWDLGKNEDIIIKYLVTNYPSQKKGRRANLQFIDWYELE